MEKESTLQWLEGREMVYSLLGWLYYKGPMEELLSTLIEEGLLAQLAENMDNPSLVEGSHQMNEELTQKLFEQSYQKALWEEYNRLFVGPGPLQAPPWESVYRSRDHLVFGQETLAVREFYRRFGLEVREYNKEPDDHIGLEMEFMAFLSKEAANMIRSGQDALVFINGGQQFLADHLMGWVPELCWDMEEAAKTDFFCGLAKFTRGWLEFDSSAFGEWQY